MTIETHTDWTEQGKQNYLNKVAVMAQDFIESPELPAGIEIEDVEFIVGDSSVEIDEKDNTLKATLSYCFNYSGLPGHMLDNYPSSENVEITASLDNPFEIE